MKYIELDQIESVQIDHTSRCNLLCPQCARVYNGSTNPEMPIGELTLDDYKKIFIEPLIKNVKLITQCGNYGDVIASNNILECLDWVRGQGSTAFINIMTNGSARSKDWWIELAGIIGDRGKVVFSIDGLEDTNSIYRVNSNFEKIIDNAKTFISANGKARWDFLVFSHNEHQVEDAKKLAQQLGFIEFNVKKTNRFINEKNYQGWVKTELVDTVKTKKAEYAIQAPTKKYQANSSLQFDQIVKEFGSWNNYINKTVIDCKFRNQKSVFIDFEARLWPCTWTASGMYHYGVNTQKTQIKQLLDYYGYHFNSIRHSSLEEILNHEWLNSKLVESWGLEIESTPVSKLMCCGRTCGSIYDFSSSSNSNRERIIFNEEH